jgi:hypothetical protein
MIGTVGGVKMRVPHRPALGALAGLGISTGLGLLLAVTSSAAPPSLSMVATDAVIGQTIQATAQLSESPGAEGEISFEVFGPGDPSCLGPALSPAPAAASVSGEGEYASGEFTPTEAGIYRWSAHYSGDSENPAADSTCSASSTVGQASPTLAGTATSAVVVGSSITDGVTLANGFEAGGQLVFRAYGPGDQSCAGAAKYEATVAVDGDGLYSPPGFSPPAGLYRWTVEYGGDENNEAAGLPCGSSNQASTVNKASPTLAGTATSAVVVGSSITDGVTLANGFEAGGQLVFRAYGPGDQSCAGAAKYEATVAVDGDGLYSPPGFSPPAGLYRWTVEYGGDENNEAAGLPCGSSNQASTVNKATPELTGTASSGVVNTGIRDEATLTGGFSPTGEVTFKVYGPEDAACLTPLRTDSAPLQVGHAVSADFLPQQAGEFHWTASYAGDENNEPASLSCAAAGQTSTVGQASPTLAGTATSAVVVGSSITDGVTLANGFEAGGQLVFRAYGPGDQSCAGAAKYEATVAVDGDGLYSPPGFSPPAGLYRWTVEYGGDENNEAAGLPCGSVNQASAVGMITAALAANATGNTVGNPVAATASIQEGAIPTGQITFTAFSPGDTNCSGAPAFSSTVNVSGNGSYRSAVFVPSRVGTFRWTVSYSGDPNHAPLEAGCGSATSSVSPASPSIAGDVTQRLTVGTSFRVTATLQGGYTPAGTITFEIYRRVAAGCAKPVAVGVIPVTGNGTFQSDPLVAHQPGTYSFGASYSGDAANQGATDPCDPSGPAVRVYRRTPKVKPRARLIEGNQISIRAHLSGAASPSGVINFRLYPPGDKQCKHKPAFSGGVTARSNGNYLLAQYFATKPGVYRLSVGYSGDQLNRQYKPTCRGAQQIRIG